MVDTLVSKTNAEGRVGSTPTLETDAIMSQLSQL